MANQNYSGSRYRSAPDVRDDRASWSPSDDQNRSDREPDDDRGVQDRNRWSYTDHDTGNFDREREPMPTERYGQGQSGYSAGRQGADRSQGYQNRNQMYPSGGYGERSSRTGMGLDDRFTGRGGSTDWGQRSDYQPDRAGQGDRVRDSGYSREPRVDDRNRSSSGHSVTGHRGKGPKNWQRSDERIREAVNEALADHDEIDATHILVTVKDGEVALTGTVEDRRMKRLAEDCVEQVSGVKEVQNQIRLQGSERQTGGNGNIRSDEKPQSTASEDRKPRA